MKTVIILAVLLCAGHIIRAQNHPYEVKFSYQIESDLANEKITPSKAGLLYSLIGDYQNSNRCSDIPVSWGIDSLTLDNLNYKPALPLIVEQARHRSIVIISENHLKPQHRIFASEIIRELTKLGFSHLGLETFSNVSNSNMLLDSALSSRGYPLNSPITGTYTLEPQMAELVRNAIELDYILFAYERSEKIDGKDRDEIQADNIIRYIEDNPNSKIVIVCGFHHAIESDIRKRERFYWMAHYLKRKLGVDPLTIYQDNFTEKFIENEHVVLKQLCISEPSTFINQEEELVKISAHVDIEVVHPKTTYINRRPSWLYKDEDYKPVKVKLNRQAQNFPIIVSAYRTNETSAVPIDRIELKHKYDTKELVLKKGKYRIEVYDGANSEAYFTTVE